MTAHTTTSRPGARQNVARSQVRRDIQGLRAVAVLGVVVFHIWPTRLSGGYVGVDVFFVISGFLISDHLFRTPPRSGRDLLTFWARRIRRLLPAASTVLLVTLVAGWVWLPRPQLPTLAHEAIASALYVENWQLASTATDYLASQDAPSPLQHYWSLSVEEQYYIVWPVLLLLLYAVGRRVSRRAGHPAMFPVWTGLGAIFIASLAFSVYLTTANPAAAYFVTPTRVWELALGALTALVARTFAVPRRGPARATMAWAGLGMVAVAMARFHSGTPFPGWVALLPTAGTAAVLLASVDDVPWSPRRLLGWRPSQVLGDVSYSTYLWHWPAVIIAPYALGGPMSRVEKFALFAVVVLVSIASKAVIEDPARRAPRLVRSTRLTFAFGALSILVVSTGGGLVLARENAAVVADRQTLSRGLASDPCVGAAATRKASCHSVTGTSLLMSPALARDDKPVLYADNCWNRAPFTSRISCHYGPTNAEHRMALLGNSHAGQWEPPLEPLIKDGWSLDTYVVSECYTVTVPIQFNRQSGTDNCESYNRWAIEQVTKGHYDLVVMSQRTYRPLVGVPASRKDAAARTAYAQTLRTITNSGTRVLVIRDTPEAGGSAPDCIDAHPGDLTACDNPKAKVLEPDPEYEAAKADRSGLVSTLDLTSMFCPTDTCHVVIGRLIVYFDHGHMTRTFSSTLAPEVVAAARKAAGLP